jgi:glycerophosphoryl diester phosphodiesterase
MGMTRRQMALSTVGLVAMGCMPRGGGEPSFPIVIAHRGASGERPEHTLGAYQLGIDQGADFIEPDLVMSKDGVLVCRHENEISETTDVASRSEFLSRRATKQIDGQDFTGWFVEDFTLAELKTLRCIERLAQIRPSNMAYNGTEQIPTFAEVMALAKAAQVGVYPELKHPSHHHSRGLDPVAALATALREGGFGAHPDRVFVQCFEIGALKAFSQATANQFACIQLISAEGGPADDPAQTYANMLTDEGLAAIKTYAVGIGVQKSLIIPRDSADRSLAPTDLVARAHAAGLKVHAWTFRSENTFLPEELRAGSDPTARGDGRAEVTAFLELGVDGVFSDFPEDAFEAREAWSANP